VNYDAEKRKKWKSGEKNAPRFEIFRKRFYLCSMKGEAK